MVFKKSLISEDKIRLKILDLLSRREHSFKEILLKLKDRVDSKDKLNEELIKIRDENLQSDERFTESYVRARSLRGIGPEKISYELISKGVNSNTIDRIIYSKEIDWMKVLEKEFKKKYKSNADFSLDEISKAKKFFLQRGFNIELVNEFFKR